MRKKALHFMYEDKEPGRSFANSLIEKLGQTSLDEARTIISIGGDGMLLRAFRESNGRKVFGITPPESNSRGFWTDHDIKTADDLLEKLAEAKKYRVTPLKGVVHFADGKPSKEIIAYNDIMIERPTPQAVLFNLTATFNGETLGPHRIMAGGYIFSTAYGSTGGSRHYGGTVFPLGSNIILLTGKGVFEPHGTHPTAVAMDGTVFRADFISSQEKRPVRIDYDGHSIHGNIRTLEIEAAPEKAATFLTMYNSSTRAFTSTMPKQ